MDCGVFENYFLKIALLLDYGFFKKYFQKKKLKKKTFPLGDLGSHKKKIITLRTHLDLKLQKNFLNIHNCSS